MTTRTLVDRVTARVFCHGPGGGNPVTVFASQFPLSASVQKRLAKECEWESVMVAKSSSSVSSSSENNDNNNNNTLIVPKMSFYMPSGEEVSFCAHAALGGASAVAFSNDNNNNNSIQEEEEFSFCINMTGDMHTVNLLINGNGQAEEEEENEENEKEGISACLYMTVPFSVAPVSNPPGLQRLLRDHLGLSGIHLNPKQGGRRLPTFLNASVARPKTLVSVNSLQALANAKTPKVSSVSSSSSSTTSDDKNKRFSFANACNSIDESTGIYLYAQKDVDSWECRQFPRSSGYPEDPATGIAAAALAVSLFRNGIYLPVYKFYQGTTMGRPSLIEVLDLKETDSMMISYGLQGKVEIDERDTLEIETTTTNDG